MCGIVVPSFEKERVFFFGVVLIGARFLPVVCRETDAGIRCTHLCQFLPLERRPTARVTFESFRNGETFSDSFSDDGSSHDVSKKQPPIWG